MRLPQIKKHHLHIIAVALICFSMTSCFSLVVNTIGLDEEEVEVKKISSKDKELVFIPMHHIGVSAFYRDVAAKVDSLNRLGYICLYETARSDLSDSLEIRNVMKKYRKITGVGIPFGNTYVSVLNKLGANELISKNNLVDQPGYYELNVDTATAVRADLPLEVLISSWEREYGEVVLDECDLKTGLDTIYDCERLDKKLKRKFQADFILGMRDKKIAQTVYDTEATKFFVIYGKHHWRGLVQELKQIDPSWAMK